jgi:hypothetical protein
MKVRVTLSGCRVRDFLRWALIILSWFAFAGISRKSVGEVVSWVDGWVGWDRIGGS